MAPELGVFDAVVDRAMLVPGELKDVAPVFREVLEKVLVASVEFLEVDDVESRLPTEKQNSSRLDICEYIDGAAVETNRAQLEAALLNEVGIQELLLKQRQ